MGRRGEGGGVGVGVGEGCKGGGIVGVSLKEQRSLDKSIGKCSVFFSLVSFRVLNNRLSSFNRERRRLISLRIAQGALLYTQ